MKPRIIVSVAVSLVVMVIAGAALRWAFTRTLPGRVGQDCRVVLNRDRLGLASATGASLETDGYNGVDVSIPGRLVAVNEQFVAIETAKMRAGELRSVEVWIPRESILVIIVDRGKLQE